MPDNKLQGGPLTPEQQLFKNIADKQLVDLKLDKARPVVPQPKPTEYKQPVNTDPTKVEDVSGDTHSNRGLVNLVKNLHGDKATAFHATSGGFGFYTRTPQVTNYGEYDLDKNITITQDTTQEQLDMMRADEQSLGGEVLNSALGAIVKAPIKLASSFSSFLVDTDSYSKLNDSMWNQVMKNSTETLNQMDEKVGDVFKVHGADDQADGTFTNREWWMKNAFQEGGAYLLGFMAAGAGTSALMARVAQGSSAVFASLATRVYNAASVGGKIEKAAVAARAMLPSIRMGLKGAGELTTSFMLADLEASAEALSVADEVYKQKYAEYLEKAGYDPNDQTIPLSVREAADKYGGQIAANAGDVTRNVGRLTAVFNITGLKYFTGPKLSTTKYVKHTLGKAVKDVALEIPQEMGEELLMGVGGTLARRQAAENLTAENGGGMFSNSHLVSDTWNHVFSQQGAEEAVLGGVLGGGFGAIGELVKAKSGANKTNNDLADFQASNTTTEGYLKQLLDPTSNIAKSIKNLKNLSDTQADLFPKITEAHLKGDEVSADNMRAQLLQFQAYDYFQKGMGDQLNATMEALTSDKQLAEETFGPDYHEKLAEAKKIIKEAQGVYDTEVPFAPAGSEKMLYHNILNRNNISKAIHTVRTELAKHRQQYIQDLANYTAEGLGVPSMEGLSYDVSKQEEEFKKSNPLSLQKVTENETKLAELQSQFKQNQAQHTLIRKGKYREFEQAAKIKGTEEYIKPQVKEEAKLAKEEELKANTKEQEVQSIVNDIQDESKPQVTAESVAQNIKAKKAELLQERAEALADLDSRRSGKFLKGSPQYDQETKDLQYEIDGQFYDKIAELEDTKNTIVEKVGEPEYEKGDHAKVKELAERISKEGYSNAAEDQQLATNYPKLLEKYLQEIKNSQESGVDVTELQEPTNTSNSAETVDSEGNIHSPVVKTIYSQGFNRRGEFDMENSTSRFTEGDSVYKVFYHKNGDITYQVCEENNTFKNVKDTLTGSIEAFTEITNSFKSQTKINTLEPGILKEENGKLVIVKKAKIEYSDTLKPFDETIVVKNTIPTSSPDIDFEEIDETPITQPYQDYDQPTDSELGVFGDDQPMEEVVEPVNAEENKEDIVPVMPPKKLVHIPTSISVKTIESKDNVFTEEASNPGGDTEGFDKQQAANVLDNGPNSIQVKTDLYIHKTEFEGETAYAFKTEDGRLAGYLHKPEYVRESRLATEKLTPDERDAEIAKQKAELQDMWDKLNTYFSVRTEPYKTVVTDKTQGTLNTKLTKHKVDSSVLSDPRVVVFPVIKTEESDVNTIQLAGKSVSMYLDDLEGVLEEGALDYVLENKDVAGNHIILVPTAKRTAGRIVYNFAYTQKTVLSAPGNEKVKALVEKIIDNYLEGNASAKDQEFVKNILASEIEFGTYPDKIRLKVKVGRGEKAALVTKENKGALENIAIKLPLSYKHNESVTIAGEAIIPQMFIGSTLETKLSFSVLEDGKNTNSYVLNPVLSFKPIELETDIAASQESQLEEPVTPVVKPVKKLKSPLKDNNILSQLDSLPKDKGFNIIKKEALVKSIGLYMFDHISGEGKGKSVAEVLEWVKESMVGNKEYYEYLVQHGLDEDDLAAGEVDDKEYNQSLVDNIQYVLDNYEVLSNNALRSLKDTGYDLKKDTRDLGKAEIVKKPEDVESSSIDNDTTDVTDSSKVDKPEEAVSSKFDKMMFEESPYEISSAFVRTWLNTIGSGKRSLIGGTESYGGKKLFGELMNLFKDRVFEEPDFQAVVEKEGVSKPHFADLAKKFKTLPKHYKKQILNSLHITKANFRASVGGRVFDSNRNTKEIQLKDMVKQGIQNLLEEGVAGGFNTLTLSGEAYLKALQRLSENTEKGVSLDFNKVVKVFEGISVPVAVDVLERLKKDGKSFKKGLLDAIISNIDEALNVRTLDEVKMNDAMFNRLIGAPNADVKSNLQEYIIESDGDSIVTVEGKKIYPFGIHHFTSILWSKLKDPKNGSSLRDQLKTVPFISENTWLKDNNFGQIIYMDGAAVAEGKAKTYDQLTTAEKFKVKFDFFKNSTSKKYSWWSSAKSDKSLIIGIEAGKVEGNLESMTKAVANIIAAEAKRINQFSTLPKEKGVNGSLFYLFPELNEMSDLFRDVQVGDEVVRQVKAEYLAPGYAKLQGYAKKIINEEISKALKILDRDSKNPMSPEDKAEVERFVVSELVNNYNYQSLVSGDPAYFAKKTIDATAANLFKRLTRDIATAKRGRGDYDKLRIFTFKEPGGENLISKNIIQLEATLGDQASGYRNVQAADAQGYCTFKEYVDLLWGDGAIEEEQRNMMIKEFNDHFESQGTVKGFVLSEAAGKDILFKPRKPVTIGNKYIATGVDASGNTVGVNRPIYVKYSIFPLMPSVIDGDERLVRMADFMEEKGLHRAVAESGFKVGMGKPVDLEADTIEFGDDNLTEVDRDMDGNQLDIPYDETKEAILQGTQMLKLVFDSVEDAELKEEFYKNQAALLDKGNDEYKASMGIELVGDTYQVVDIDKFKQSLEKALTDSFENPNDKASFETEGRRFKLPLFFNKLGPKIESTLIQGFKKNVLKNKLGGRSFVLVSEYLFSGKSSAIIKTDSYDPERGLLPARLMKDGREATPEEIKAHYANPTENPLTVAPAQVMVAWNFKDERGNILDINKFMKNGKIDMSKISPDMLKMIGYRIPTQGHNSMSVCEIVGFLPAYMGDTIIAPKDFTVQMGSDFDIDKIFMHFKYSKVVKGMLVANDKYALENSIIDNYNSVLSKPEVFRKMMLPLDFGRLPEIVAELKKNPRFQDTKGSILSPVTQVNNYETGTAGKIGVGMSSLLSVFASIVQGMNLRLSADRAFSIQSGDRVIDLTDLTSPNQVLDPTKSKNMVISAFQSASVDNIKELLVKTINYNSKTHPILISMSMLGLDEEWISYMMVQDPLVMKQVPKEYKISNLKPLSLELLKKGALNPDMLTVDERAHIAKYYEMAQFIGDELSKVSGVVNITTNGFGAYIEDINYLETSSSINGEAMALDNKSVDNVVNDKFWGKGYKYMLQTKDIINQFFPTSTKLYKATMSYGEGLMTYPTKEFKKTLKNFIKSYMMSDLSMYNGSVEDQRNRLFFGENSLAHRASMLKASNPENSFLQSLSFNFSNSPAKPSLVKYVGKSLTTTEKFVWQTQLKEMFNSENEIESEFARDFIIYQYAAGGIQVPTSAISMLPADLVNEMGLADDLSKINWSEDFATTNDIITQFVEHHGAKFKLKETNEKGFFGMSEVVKNASSKPVMKQPTSTVKILNDTDVLAYNNYLTKTGGKKPFEFFTSSSVFKEFYNPQTGKREPAPQSSVWSLKNNGLYDLVDKESGEIYITDVDLKTGMQNIFEEADSNVVKETTLEDALFTVSMGEYQGIVENLAGIEPTTVTYVSNYEEEGTYDLETGEIVINNSMSDEDKARVLIHETVHHVLANTVDLYKRGELEGDAKRAMTRMDNLYKFALTKQDSFKGDKNVFKDLQEFVSEMASNKEVQEWANNIKQDVENSIWTKFKKFAFNILKSLALVDLKEDSLLEEFLDTYLEAKEYRVVGKSEGKLKSPLESNVLPLVGNEEHYRKFDLLTNEGALKGWSKAEGKRVLGKLRQSPYYSFVFRPALRKEKGLKDIIFISKSSLALQKGFKEEVKIPVEKQKEFANFVEKASVSEYTKDIAKLMSKAEWNSLTVQEQQRIKNCN